MLTHCRVEALVVEVEGRVAAQLAECSLHAKSSDFGKLPEIDLAAPHRMHTPQTHFPLVEPVQDGVDAPVELQNCRELLLLGDAPDAHVFEECGFVDIVKALSSDALELRAEGAPVSLLVKLAEENSDLDALPVGATLGENVVELVLGLLGELGEGLARVEGLERGEVAVLETAGDDVCEGRPVSLVRNEVLLDSPN